MDFEERLLGDFITSLADMELDTQQLNIIKFKLSLILGDYEIGTKKYELLNVNTEDAFYYLKAFLVAKKVEGCSDKTLRYYKPTIARLIENLNKPVQEITTNDLRVYIAHRDVTKVTQDNELRIFRSFFGWLLAEEYTKKDPTKRIKAIHKRSQVKKPFTEIELERLRNTAVNSRDKAIIEVLLSTGCRIGEIENMKISDINGDTVVVLGKGDKERYVYLNAKSMFALDKYLKERDDDDPALFVTSIKPYRPLRQSGIGIVIREIGKSAGVPDTHAHRFRRTSATLALMRGMPIDQVRQMLGHTKIETTLIYAESAQDDLKMNHKKYVV